MSESVQPPRAAHPSGHAEGDEYVPAPREKKKELDFDITPMIDVVFLLLIFFMVSSTMQQSAPADAPPARNGRGLKAEGSIRLALLPEKAGVVEVELPDKTVVGLDEAAEKGLVLEAVEAAREADPGASEIILLADRDATAGDVRKVLKQLAEVDGLAFHFEVQDP